MKHTIQLTLNEARQLARDYYQANDGVAVEITDLPATNESPGRFHLSNPDVAKVNKIALIKFMRQVIQDSRSGNSDADGSLGGAKAYVENYFNC